MHLLLQKKICGKHKISKVKKWFINIHCSQVMLSSNSRMQEVQHTKMEIPPPIPAIRYQRKYPHSIQLLTLNGTLQNISWLL